MASKKPKTTVISFRVPIEEREAFEKSAVDAGTTLTGYIHATLVEARSAKSKVVPAPAPAPAPIQPPVRVPGIALSDPATLSELKRIGININQIAHAANAGLPPANKAMVETFVELFEVLSEPERFMRRLAEIKTPLDVVQAPTRKPVVSSPPPKPAASPSPPASSRDVAGPIGSRISSAPHQVPSNLAIPAPAPRISLLNQTRPSAVAKPAVAAPSPPRSTPAPASSATARPASPATPPTKRPEQPASATAPSRRTAAEREGLRQLARHLSRARRYDSPNSQARNEFQDGRGVHPPRPEQGDKQPGRLGFLRKLWGG